jgi:hypothetical protein
LAGTFFIFRILGQRDVVKERSESLVKYRGGEIFREARYVMYGVACSFAHYPIGSVRYSSIGETRSECTSIYEILQK